MAGLAETSGTTPATPTPVFNADDLYYQRRGTEYTYVNSYTLNYAPSSAINDHSLTFEVPPLSSPNCICMSELCLRLSVALVDKDNKPPAQGSLVSVVNLVSANLFRNMRLLINEVECSSSDAGTYGLKCFATMLTGLFFGAKHSSAQQYAYYEDRYKVYCILYKPPIMYQQT